MKQSVLEYKKLLEQEGLLVEFAEPEGKEGEDRPDTLVTYFSGGADQGTLYLCKGAAFKEAYLKDAINRGAVAYVSEKKYEAGKEIPALIVNDARKAQFVLGEAFYDYPAKSLHVTALTGTKGKTTTACMLYQMLKEAGVKCGLIGTLGVRRSDGLKKPGSNTTPDALVLQKELREMADAGCSCCVMEVSSQGLKHYRVEGITFAIGIYTNLSMDHIGPGEHRSFREYACCKKRLFERSRVICINADDKYHGFMTANFEAPVYTYGIEQPCDVKAEHIIYERSSRGLNVTYQTTGWIKDEIVLKMPGTANVYNSLAAMEAAHLLGISPETIRKTLRNVSVKGRIEEVRISDKFDVVIDYAHNAASLESLIKTLRQYQPKRLVLLFGCGGNRSPLRRFQMGETAGRLSDVTILTSDNPRYEKPEAILSDIEQGMKRTKGKYKIIPDRREAISYAISQAQEGDLIVVAGKGHEEYQEIEGHFYPMNEREMIENSI